jgi:succinate dehydrogenase/fumarate reductase flavoprotein subunit
VQWPWLPKKWDMEADIVVIGFGGAGAATAITAHELGATVLMLEKAPEGEEGGNTRVSGQGYLNVRGVDNAFRYMTALCGPYRVPKEMIHAWAEEESKNNDWIVSIGGVPQEHHHQPEGIEFPDLPGAECVHKFHHGERTGYSNTWTLFERAVKERPINILYESPARELIQDGITKEIIGVRAEQKGKSIYVKARRAVVLTCGGFENNQEMIRNYLPGIPYCYPQGTPYNEGDGISMALSVGADLWHMNNYAGPTMALKVPEYKTTFSMTPLHFELEQKGGMIVVGLDAKRFADEKFKALHGKEKRSGQWGAMFMPCPMFMVFDDALFSCSPLYDKTPRSGWGRIIERYDWSSDNTAELKRGWIKRAATIKALAQMIGLDPIALEDSIHRWNSSCDDGKDAEFKRTKMLVPLRKPPFYAIELSPSMLNTQGGPRRNERGQVVRPDNSPIPRLYSAGELGSIFSYLYQGAGNIGECLSFGRISARNAVAESPWDK